MSINLVNDIGAPLAVTAIDLVSETTFPQANEPLAYIVAAGGMILTGMRVGGEFTKNMAIAATPWAAKNLYTRIRAMTGGTAPVSRLGMRVSRWPAPTVERPFGGGRLV